MKQFFRSLIRKLGIDIVKYPAYFSVTSKRSRFIASHGINVVLDVGANNGIFAKELRQQGFRGKIISFEPLNGPFCELIISSRNDPNWEAHNIALGDSESTSFIHISKNSFSSSVYKMSSELLNVLPKAQCVGSQEIQIKRLDSLYHSFHSPSNKYYLKIDVQGFEDRVLQGATESLNLIHSIELEMSFTKLYEEQLLFPELYEKMKVLGYELIDIDPEFYDQQSGKLLQINGVFHRFTGDR